MMRLLLSLGVLISFTACHWDKSKPNIEPIQDMMDQAAVKAQKEDDFFKGGISSQVPPENTQPVGFKPYKYPTDPERAGRELKNPLAGQNSEDVLMVGQKYFETNCMVCHGVKGLGDGSIASKYPLKIPALNSDKVKNWQDGQIYHVITMGQGTMGPYAAQVPQKVRWHLVNYIRHLQQKL